MTSCGGIDLSHNNPRQSWAVLKSGGVKFAFIKASEGEHTQDPLFSAHISDAKAAKITVLGAYHFAWPNENAALNASNYISTVKTVAGPGFVHWLDLEPYADGRNYTGRTAGEITEWVEFWLTAVQKAFPGQRVGVYGNAAENAHIPPGWPRWFARYPWTEASYATAAASAYPRVGGKAADFWQFCSSPLDRDLFPGSEADLVRWAAGGSSSPAPAKPPAPKPTPKTVVVRAGMTLGAIALTLGSTVAVLAQYNHIKDPDVIRPGQTISAPPPAPAKPKPPKAPVVKPAKPKPPPAPAYTVHTVRQDETLSGIAAAAGIKDWHTLASYNHLANPDLIRPGQTIRIPRKK